MPLRSAWRHRPACLHPLLHHLLMLLRQMPALDEVPREEPDRR